MKYTEVTFLLKPLDPWRDILIAELGDIGFDSFEETAHGLKAYIPSAHYRPVEMAGLHVLRDEQVTISHKVRDVEPRNWNALWESSFEPVEVGGKVRIRADFHPHVPGFEHELVITPRMAFGTGHHATTRMMVEAMLGIPFSGKHVCDLGCGTAVLAILSIRLGAASVHAIDIDEQAVLNARENCVLNKCPQVLVDKGDVALLKPATCDVILANIERNTLLRDMAAMRDALRPGGTLLLSGFVVKDMDIMGDGVVAAGLIPDRSLAQGEWALIGCTRP